MRNSNLKTKLLTIASAITLLTSAALAQAPEKISPVDPSVQTPQADDTVPSVYKDMVVVQRKAKTKARKFLFAPSSTLDFSDGPITAYAINTNIGYAFSEFWELYLGFAPSYYTVERPIVGKVRTLTLASGQTADITYAKPKMAYGLELLWAPAYGKESWGPYSIVRSDTFFKLGLWQTQFTSGDKGNRYSGTVGKTYFINKLINIRVAAGMSYAQAVVDTEKTGSWAPTLETGLVFYF